MSSVLKSKLRSISFGKAFAIVAVLYIITVSLESIYGRSPLEDKWSGDVFLIDNKGELKPLAVTMSLILNMGETLERRNGRETYEMYSTGYQIKFYGEDKAKMLSYGFNDEHVSDSPLTSEGSCSGNAKVGNRFLRITPNLSTGFGPLFDVHGHNDCKNFQFQADGFSEMAFQGGKDFRVMGVLTRNWDLNLLQRTIMYFRWSNFRNSHR